MTISCIIVEDEPLPRERLIEYVRRVPSLSLLAAFDNATDALLFLQQQPVDLVFLDVALGGWSGMDLLESSAVTGQVVLTTAHHEHAVRAYDLKVADYLLKPFTFERFVQAVERARIMAQRPTIPTDREAFFVKTEFRLERVRLADLLYIEGSRDYRRIHTVDKRIMTLQTFGDFERQLAPAEVCRVHRSYMVSIGRIESIERDRIRIRGALIPISESYRERFYALIGHREG